ncbi:Aminotransferase-like, plant mobile domain [Sesbania bispinosa]|nr:Aminotransferase-like, plant mobile domain [Sesbania bispinosa]
MARSRPTPTEATSGSSSVPTSETVNEPMPRSISLVILPKLPPPRAAPTTTDSHRWLSCVPRAKRPFDIFVISSGGALFSSSVAFSSARLSDALLRYPISGTPSLELANAFNPMVGRAEWVNHVFSTDKPFITVLSQVGIADAIWISPSLSVQRRSEDLTVLIECWSCKTHTFLTSWGEFSPTLEDVAVLLKLPITLDILAKKLALRRAHQTDVGSHSTVKMRLPKRWCSQDAPLLQTRKSEKMKYTYASCIRFFFGDFPLGDHFEAGPDHPQPLERAAFIAFWLSRYVFFGPPWESMSPAIITLASLLAEGIRLPLASFYLGGLYGRLYQIQEQMYFSYGHFSINSCVDAVFVQMFLYERFPRYGPVRRVPKPPLEEDVFPEYQGWSLGRPRHPLVDLIDDENSFMFCPYTSSFSLGVEGMNRIYLEPSFSTRNNKGSWLECVYDFWLMCVRPRVLPGFIVTDTVGLIGSALFPFLYRPNQVCRQFELDQPPISLDLDPLSLQDVMRSILFVERQELPSFDPALFVPPGRVGRILDEWVIYQGRLKAFVAFFEGVKSTSPPHEILIMYKDSYYITFHVPSKKRKLAPLLKGKTKLCAIAPSIIKNSKRTPLVSKRPFAQTTAPQSFLIASKSSPNSREIRAIQLTSHKTPHCSRILHVQIPLKIRMCLMQVLWLVLAIRGRECVPSSQPQVVIHKFSVEVVNLPAHMVMPLAGSGEWFNELMRSFNRSIPPSAFEDLNKISGAIKALQSKIDKKTATLALYESELSQLLIKKKEIEDAQASLNVMFSF